MLSLPSSAPVASFNRNMFCFTRSISALNTMTFSMGVLRAKNAFMKKLSQDRLMTPADYKEAGDRQWEDIAAKHQVCLSLAGMDFSDLKRDQLDTSKRRVKNNLPYSHLQNGIPPPPPPPNSGAPPPPPPNSGAPR